MVQSLAEQFLHRSPQSRTSKQSPKPSGFVRESAATGPQQLRDEQLGRGRSFRGSALRGGPCPCFGRRLRGRCGLPHSGSAKEPKTQKRVQPPLVIGISRRGYLSMALVEGWGIGRHLGNLNTEGELSLQGKNRKLGNLSEASALHKLAKPANPSSHPLQAIRHTSKSSACNSRFWTCGSRSGPVFHADFTQISRLPVGGSFSNQEEQQPPGTFVNRRQWGPFLRGLSRGSPPVASANGCSGSPHLPTTATPAGWPRSRSPWRQ